MWIETNSLFQIPVTALKNTEQRKFDALSHLWIFIIFSLLSHVSSNSNCSVIIPKNKSLFCLCIFHVTLHYLSLLVQVSKYWGLFLVNIWYLWVMHRITHHSQNPCIIITLPAWKKDQHWSFFNSLENMQAVLIFTVILMMLYLLRI